MLFSLKKSISTNLYIVMKTALHCSQASRLTNILASADFRDQPSIYWPVPISGVDHQMSASVDFRGRPSIYRPVPTSGVNHQYISQCRFQGSTINISASADFRGRPSIYRSVLTSGVDHQYIGQCQVQGSTINILASADFRDPNLLRKWSSSLSVYPSLLFN